MGKDIRTKKLIKETEQKRKEAQDLTKRLENYKSLQHIFKAQMHVDNITETEYTDIMTLVDIMFRYDLLTEETLDQITTMFSIELDY